VLEEYTGKTPLSVDVLNHLNILRLWCNSHIAAKKGVNHIGYDP
jgi:hypothetical protein